MAYPNHGHFLRNLVIVIVVLAFVALAVNLYQPAPTMQPYTELPPVEEEVETPVMQRLTPVSLSATQLVLMQGESRDITLTVGNNYETAKEFELIIDCTDYQGTGCAKLDIRGEDKLTVPAEQLKNTQISINTLSDIEKGTYELLVYARQNNKTHGKEQLFIQIK
ncbi:hypothetical protein GF371_02785 [Candidatus Woesearchaeota archaeon]|nr:hypothetical protein [Candidatus Woesearchaeota archaeon]